MSDEEIRAHLVDIYSTIKGMRIAHFQATLCVQALRLLIQANADLERQYGKIFSELTQATDARQFPAEIALLDQKIRHLRSLWDC